MAEEIRDLIEKINQEGIKAAEKKAAEIEVAAKQKAEEVLAKARLEAEKIMAAAKDRISHEEEKGKALLNQAVRDLLLTLKKEINAMLESIVITETRHALNAESLSKLLSELIKSYASKQTADIVVSLKREDSEAFEKSFLHKLKEETHKGITLKPSEEITGGFTISFDSGKSCYDFTDRALAEYIGTFLKPKLNQILQDAVSGIK